MSTKTPTAPSAIETLARRICDLSVTCDRLADAITHHSAQADAATDADDRDYHRVQVEAAVALRETRRGQLGAETALAEMEIERLLGVARRAAARARAIEAEITTSETTRRVWHRHLSRCRCALSDATNLWWAIGREGSHPYDRHQSETRG